LLRDLETYLRALLGLGRQLRRPSTPSREPNPDEVAALFTAAATAPAIDLEASWRERPTALEGAAPPRPRPLRGDPHPSDR
jgi:hypothetical protein